MITLIAESKTMKLPSTESINPGLACKPIFLDEAAAISRFVSSMPTQELAARMKVSNAIAYKEIILAQNFFIDSVQEEALRAFTGEVFKAIDINTLSGEALEFAKQHLKIISSLYGILDTDTLVKPYRLDFSAPCAPDDESLKKFWKPKVTIAFVKWLKKSGEKEILNLLPADASQCIDWKLVRAFAKTERPAFKAIKENGELATPNAGKLKELRGKMVRTILENKIDSLKDVLALETPHFSAAPDLHRPLQPLFLC